MTIRFYLLQIIATACVWLLYAHTSNFQTKQRTYRNIQEPLTHRAQGASIVLTDSRVANTSILADTFTVDASNTTHLQQVNAHANHLHIQANSAQVKQDTLVLIGDVRASSVGEQLRTTRVVWHPVQGTITSRTPTYYQTKDIQVHASGFRYDTIKSLLHLEKPRALLTSVKSL